MNPPNQAAGKMILVRFIIGSDICFLYLRLHPEAVPLDANISSNAWNQDDCLETNKYFDESGIFDTDTTL